MRAPGLAGLTRHARRHRAVPVGTVEDFPVRGAVTLHVIPTPARGIDRVAVAATGDPGKVERGGDGVAEHRAVQRDRKSTRLNSSHVSISYAVFCLKKKKKEYKQEELRDLG